MADVQHRVTDLENEIKVMKNEIKAILLDIREQYLNTENPFNPAGQAAFGDNTAVNTITPNPSSTSATNTGVSNIPSASIPQGDIMTPHDVEPSVEEKLSTNTNKEHDKENETESSIAIPPPQPESSADDETPPATKLADNKVTTEPVDLTKLEPVIAKESSRDEKRNKKDSAVPSPSLESYAEEKEALLKAETWIQKEASQKGTRTSRENGNRINLITIAGLSRWVDESTEKIGKERTEVMVEACHMVGHISLELKDLLIKLVHLAQADEPKKGKITTRDYLGVIAQLDNLLGYSTESEAALLTILTNSKEPIYG